MTLSFLRSLLITAPLIILATVVMGTISAACSFFDPQGHKQHAISSAWARMLLAISRVKVNRRGLEKLDPAGNYIFAGNHLSLMDTPVVLGHIPYQFLFLVNVKYVRLPFLGTHLRRGGHFAVNPDDMRAGLKILTEAARHVQARKLSVLLFPEGARARGGLQGFKEGAAYIAIKSGAAIVPFALKGTRDVLPIGSVHIRGGTVEFLIGDPIPTAGLTIKDRAALTDQMRASVGELLDRLGGKAQPAINVL
ncbi:MAG: 1-acyl-sn-glycerol-3-phosphate acyltransferase [Acidobacteriia bacterium]|nr:1-acyl-sn-glycerol-3-phosphate acyltransferase [Terriglobia bacterium]